MSIIEIECNATSLPCLEAFLREVTTASRVGHADWSHCEVRAIVRLGGDSQAIKPLQDFVKHHDHIAGLALSSSIKPLNPVPPSTPSTAP